MATTKTRALKVRSERSLRDRVYGSAVVRRGLVDEDLMEQLLEAREGLGDEEVAPIWEELVKNLLIDEQQAKEIYEPLKSFLEEETGKKRLFRKKRFAEAGLEVGLLTPAQLSELIERHYHLGKGGRRPPPIGQIALGLGMLSEADIDRIQDAQRSLFSLAARRTQQYVVQHPVIIKVGVPLLIAIVTILAIRKAYYGVPDDSWLAGLRRIEWMLYDLRFKLRADRKPPGDVVILDIDQRTMQRFQNRWPFTRAVMGEVLERLTEAGVRTVGWDVLFTSPDNPEEVEAMEALVGRYRRIHDIKHTGGTVKDAWEAAMGRAGGEEDTESSEDDWGDAEEEGTTEGEGDEWPDEFEDGSGDGSGAEDAGNAEETDGGGEDEWPDEFQDVKPEGEQEGGPAKTGEDEGAGAAEEDWPEEFQDVKPADEQKEGAAEAGEAKGAETAEDEWPDEFQDVRPAGEQEDGAAKTEEAKGEEVAEDDWPAEFKDVGETGEQEKGVAGAGDPKGAEAAEDDWPDELEAETQPPSVRDTIAAVDAPPFYSILMSSYDEMLHDHHFARAIKAADEDDIYVVAAMYFIPERAKETAKTFADLDPDLFGRSEFEVLRLLDPFNPGQFADEHLGAAIKRQVNAYEPNMVGVLGAIKPISEAVSAQGFVNTIPGVDGIVRAMWTSIPFQLGEGQQHRFYPPMGLQCAWWYLAQESLTPLEVHWAAASTPFGVRAFGQGVKIGGQELELDEQGRMYLNYYGDGNWKEYSEVAVAGAGVDRPGTYVLRKRYGSPQRSLREILREAGIRADAAKKCFVRRVAVEMNGEEWQEVFLMPVASARTGRGQGGWLKSGDVIYVPGPPTEEPSISIYGEVVKPGTFPLDGDRASLSELVAEAGGYTFLRTVDARRSCLIRPGGDSENPFKFPVYEDGWLSDEITLQPGDILVLPRRYHRGRLFNYYSFIDVYDRQVNLKEMEGKVVIVGSTSEELNDYLPSPFGRFPGLEIQATFCQNIIEGTAIRQRGMEKYDKLALAIMTLVVAVLCAVIPVVWAPVAFLVATAGYSVYAYLQFVVGRTWCNLTAPVLGMGLAFILVTLFRYITEQREKKKVRGMFSTMVSPDVLQYMEQGPDRFRLTGEKKMATMFFSDVAGFTTISESLSAEALAMVLNRYLTPMSNIIIQYEGYIDKYEGDAIMADFGVPIWSDPDPTSHAWKACWAALEQFDKLQEVSEEIKHEFGVDIDARMGLNSGEVSAGNMGSAQKFQYTVMGDAVNQAARFEPANKPFDTHIMIGEPTYELAKDKIEVRFLTSMIVKGKTEPVKAYELVAKKGEISDEKRRVIQTFEEGWHLHAEQKWDEAIAKFDECLSIDPEDGPSKTYKEICEDYKENPPEEEWQGEYVQTSK